MQRRRYSPEQKVKIVREHFEKNISVPDICEKYRIHPNQFYRWKKALFEGAIEIFAKNQNKKHTKDKIWMKDIADYATGCWMEMS